ncbi:MAG: ring-cleaving dioxygenase [Candidatus Binatia bacterium]
MQVIQSHHHITLGVGGAQEDYDFHTKLLGLRSVKKTVLFDGKTPIYHLYYGNETGEPSTLITSFPLRQAGLKARRGSGQVKVLSLSVPAASLDFWAERLRRFEWPHDRQERFGEQRLHFAHPCGIEYEVVGTNADTRIPWTTEETPAAVAIRGMHGITVSVRELAEQDRFMETIFGFRKTAQEGSYSRYEAGEGGAGKIVDCVEEPDVPQGSWTFGDGAVHHCAFRVDSSEDQLAWKAYAEGLGYTDVSDVKDRNYFKSVYVRTPSGALFEAAKSVEQGFAIDEPVAEFGQAMQLPPWFEDQRQEILSALEPLRF